MSGIREKVEELVYGNPKVPNTEAIDEFQSIDGVIGDSVCHISESEWVSDPQYFEDEFNLDKTITFVFVPDYLQKDPHYLVDFGQRVAYVHIDDEFDGCIIEV